MEKKRKQNIFITIPLDTFLYLKIEVEFSKREIKAGYIELV